MINDPVYKRFLELSWRRKLNSAEEEQFSIWLEAHPEAQAEWEKEMGLSDLLGVAPAPLVSSNFNARVLQGIEQQQAADRRRAGQQRTAWWKRIVPRAALALGVATAGILTYQHHRLEVLREQARQAQVVQDFIAISKVPFLPDPEILEDFDTIRLAPNLVADERLLTLLQ